MKYALIAVALVPDLGGGKETTNGEQEEEEEHEEEEERFHQELQDSLKRSQ